MNNDTDGSNDRKLDACFERCRELIAKHNQDVYMGWRRVVGDRIDDLISSRDLTVACLYDDDPRKREVALKIINRYWQPDVSLTHICQNLALHDSDRDVRICAILSLGICYSKSNDKTVGGFLARFVYDSKESQQIKNIAYYAMLLIADRKDHRLQSRIEEVKLLDLPREQDPNLMDWFS